MTATSKNPRHALGIRAHSGWAAYVALAGSASTPQILARGRMELCDATIEGSKQPFHEAESMSFARTEKYIDDCRTATAKLAGRALKSIVAESGPFVGCCILTASGKPLPDLSGILASHTLIHSAEGEFYRDAVADACAGYKIAVQRVRERDMAEETSVLPLTESARRDVLTTFGKQIGHKTRNSRRWARGLSLRPRIHRANAL